MCTEGPVQALTWPNSYGYLPPKCMAAKARWVVGTLVVYSDFPQMHNLPSWSRGFNRGLGSCIEIFLFLFLSRTAPGARLCFWPHLCICVTLRGLFPAQAKGSESRGWLGYSYSLRPGRGIAATTGMCANCLLWWGPTGSCKRLGHAHSACSLWWETLLVPTETGAKGWHVSTVATPPLVHHSTMVLIS